MLNRSSPFGQVVSMKPRDHRLNCARRQCRPHQILQFTPVETYMSRMVDEKGCRVSDPH